MKTILYTFEQRRYGAMPFMFFLIIVSIAFVPSFAHATVACGSGAAAQNGIRVTPSHGQAFYIDTGVSPKLDAGYVGYQVYNGTGSSKNNLWVELSNFSGGALSLANVDDAQMQVASTSNNATSTTFFLLKATGATTQAQSHTVRVYNGRPGVSGSSLLYECSYSFTKIQETIKTSSNKVTDNTGDGVAITASTQQPELGQTFTITVEGQTGTIGNGSSPDGSIVWLTPAAVSSWPTRALRLANVSIVFDTNGNWNSTGDQITYTNQLAITNAKNAISNSADYRATYTFRVIGRPMSTVLVVPLADISSGTQVKHADTTASGATINLSFNALSIDATIAKTITSTSGLTTITCSGSCIVPGGVNGTTYAAVPYRLQVTTATSTTATVDEMIDNPQSGVIYKPSSTTITDIGRTNAVASDPIYLDSEAALVPRPYHFVGPFTFNSGTAATLNYTMYVPAGTYVNTAYAALGDTLIGTNSSAMSQVTVTSDGSASITAATSTQSFPVTVLTQPASGVTSTAATLNGTVDPNGATPLTATFEYGTSPTLATYTVVTGTTPTNGTLNGLTDPTLTAVTLSGLSVGTTYYFRAVAGTTKGDILSFTTDAVQATPTVTTNAASGITLTQATLNGTINPNLTSITAIQFLYSTSSTLATNTTTLALDDGTGVALTAGGSSAQPFATSTGTLTGGNTYYYKIRACTTSSGTYPNITCSAFVDGSIVNFIAYGAPTASTTAATNIGASVATLNGVLKANFATTTASFTYGTSSSLISNTTTVSAGTVTGSASTTVSANISGLASATTYYFKVVGSNSGGTTSGTILNFTTSAVNRTLTIDASSYTSSYRFDLAPPTISSTPSAGTGTKSYTSYTTDVCTVNTSTGLVTFVSVGTCTIGASIAASGGYTDASSATISFSITPGYRSLLIDPSSYISSYAFSSTSPTLAVNPYLGGGDLSYTSESDSVCSVDSSSGLVGFVSTGTCTIHAALTALDPYAATTSPAISFNITSGTRALSIDSSSYVPSYAMTDPPPIITATPTAGSGTLSFTSLTPGVCTIDAVSGLVAFVSVGTCVVQSSIGSDGLYNSATSTIASFTTTLASRSITIDTNSYTDSYVFDAVSPTLTSTPTAGEGSKTYTSLTPLICSINGTTGLTSFFTVGMCSAQVVIASDGFYGAATSSSISFVITPLSRTLAIDPSSYQASYIITDEQPPTIVAVPSSGVGTKTFTSQTPSVCSVVPSSGSVTFITTGTCTIGASIAASGVYDSAVADSISFTIENVPPPPGLLSRSLSIDPTYASSYAYDAAPPTLHATPTNGAGTITFTSTTMDVCTVDADTGVVSFLSTGTCRIHADITADDTYAGAASPAIAITVNPLDRTLSIDNPYDVSYAIGATPPVMHASPSAGSGEVKYTSIDTSVCTVNDSTGIVTFLATGTCIIGSSIVSSGVYNAAISQQVSFGVVPNPLLYRSLSIDEGSYASEYLISDTSPTLTSTPSAGEGAKSYTSLSTNVCVVDSVSGTVFFLATGLCEITASITSDGIYASADAQTISFTITQSPVPLTGRTFVIDPGSFNSSYVYSATPPTLTATPSAGEGIKTYTSETPGICSVDLETGVVLFLTTGTCSIHAAIAGDGTYEHAVSQPISFVINPRTRSLSIDPSSYVLSYNQNDPAPTVHSTPSTGAGTISYISQTTSVCTVDGFTGAVSFVGSGICTLQSSITVDGVDSEAVSSSISFSIIPAAIISYAHRGGSVPGSAHIGSNSAPTQPATQNAYEPVVCTPYLTSYIMLGTLNDTEQVKKLQTFLNGYEGEVLVVDGIYKTVDAEAVKRFQKKYATTLAFWGITQPTGHVYISTQREINKIYCQQMTRVLCPYFTTYQKEGDSGSEIIKIKKFLNETQGAHLDSDSDVYDSSLKSAVATFQQTYADKILYPWNLRAPTGAWYQSTKKQANDILGCFSSVTLDNGRVLK